jgi:hypothetical protein
MKLLFTILSVFISVFCNAQNKLIKGSIFLLKPTTNNKTFDTIEAKYVTIRLSKKDKTAKCKTILKTYYETNFKIVLNKYELVDFDLLEFETKNYINSVKIKSFNSSFNNIYLLKKEKPAPIEVVSPSRTVIEKPAIYLYPTKEETIEVKLDFKGILGATYPVYNKTNGWIVHAKPNGELKNYFDYRTYNYLFWEGDYTFSKEHNSYKDGFLIAKKNIVSTLQNKLAIIGLNNTEINDFVVYWLPVLNKSEYCFIHFFINDNIDNCAFLYVKPKPDSEIRIYMEFKAVDKSFTFIEQTLPSIKRTGFTLVEWGGGKTNTGKIE